MTHRGSEWGPVRVYRGRARVLSVVLLTLAYRRGTQGPDAEKSSAYECGFNPFDDARSRFDIRFYRVSILFIVFDREASYRFPWAVTLGEQGARGFYTMVEFLVERVVGYVYVWKVGALEWE